MPSACTGLLWQAVARTSDDNGPRIFFVSVSAYQEWWTSCWHRTAPWTAYSSGNFLPPGCTVQVVLAYGGAAHN